MALLRKPTTGKPTTTNSPYRLDEPTEQAATSPASITQALPDADDYASLLVEVEARVKSAQHRALRAVNAELIDLYLDLGNLILTKQDGRSWGQGVVQQLARDLRADLPER